MREGVARGRGEGTSPRAGRNWGSRARIPRRSGKRPGEFYSLELTGESSREGGALRSATVAVQCWAASRSRARELFDALQSALPTIGYQTRRIGRATLEGGYRFDDLASGTPRYQAVVRVTY